MEEQMISFPNFYLEAMALRDQPYMPLYIQDVLTDEKLAECSAATHGVYFLLLCILHKQEVYGQITLKEKYKQIISKDMSKTKLFALQISKQIHFKEDDIYNALCELIEENVMYIDGDILYQKRMREDGKLSLIRATVGKTGGSSVTKQYGKPGFLYWIGDHFDKNKIGISVNPQNRLYRLRCDLNIKNLDIITLIEVPDMGVAEDFALDYFKNDRDGEWVKLSNKEMSQKFSLFASALQAKIEANTEYESESENAGKENNLNVSFDDFWDLYDKKVGEKGKLMKKWAKLKPSERSAAMEHIPKYKLAQPDKKYRKNPDTYLNNKSWNDEIIYANGTNGTHQQQPSKNGKQAGADELSARLASKLAERGSSSTGN